MNTKGRQVIQGSVVVIIAFTLGVLEFLGDRVHGEDVDRSRLAVEVIGVAVAPEQYAIWTGSALNGLEWVRGSRTYPSRGECEEALQRRQGRLAREVNVLRRIGADDTIMRVVGDRLYECRLDLHLAPPKP